MMYRILAILLVLASLPVEADESPGGKVLKFEAGGGTMLANSKTEWSRYSGIQLEQATVKFEDNWAKEQERLNNNIVRDSDMAQIRSMMSDLLVDVLRRKLADTGDYTLANENGGDVLRFSPRIVKLDVRAPGKVQGIVGNVLVDGKGSMVIVVDIADSLSGELLASAWRLEVDPDKGFMETATEAGNRTAFKRMMENWSAWLIAMLEHVRSENATAHTGT